MRMLIVASAFVLAACTPAAETPAAEPPAGETPAAEMPTPAADLGPYTNSWDSAEFSHFRHTLSAATPGAYDLTITATTSSPGGETVAVDPVGPEGVPATARIMFVIATTRGGSETERVTIPAEGLPVEVVVENAAGRAFAGSYTLALAPAAP
ncbi:MAG: hypothetical protein KDA35_01455 [Hyphomonadaceae bacterium]|nr:hypothetical protein [Hyphomonadaceae bacterium]